MRHFIARHYRKLICERIVGHCSNALAYAFMRHVTPGRTAVPKIDLNASARFFDRLARAPFLQRLGEPIKDPDVATVKTWVAVKKSICNRSWINVLNGANNYLVQRMHVGFGGDWINSHLNQTANQLRRQLPAKVRKAVDRFEKSEGLPEYFSRDVFGAIEGVALEHALSSLIPHGAFHRNVLEKWFVAGHLPCGWKGRLPKQPRALDWTLPTEKLSVPPLEAFIGDGRLIVY
jgi:hypothetical protein